MTNGIELLRLFQRRTPEGDCFFVGTLNDAPISMTRDPRRRDIWIVAIHNPSQDSNHCGSPARLPARPADAHGWYQDDAISDDLPEDLEHEEDVR